MGSTREILTFQLGNYANFVGAHWWNIQESYFEYDEKKPSEINHDVLFREGKTQKGQTTFTPRLILVDKAENMSHLPVLRETPVKPIDLTSIDVVGISDQPLPEKHEFIKDLEKMDNGQRVDITTKDYNFSETVRTWCDYIRTKYHPKSVFAYPNNHQMDFFHSGLDLYKSMEEDLTERTRCYMEECDNLQGFQVIVDAIDGSSGLADSMLLHLRDEYSSKNIITIPVITSNYGSYTSLDNVRRSVNILLAYQKLTESTSLLVPLGTNTTAWMCQGPPTQFPNIIYSPDNLYQTSAILASFLDTMSLKYRLREDYASLHDLIFGLNYHSHKICAASLSLPFPMPPGSYLLDTLQNFDDNQPLWNQITPGCDITDDTIFYQRITVRGIPESILRDPNVHQTGRVYSCSTVAELVHLYLSYRLTTISDVVSVRTPLKTCLPYPTMFSPHVSPIGRVDEYSTRLKNFNVESCPVISGLHSGRAVGRMLDSLHTCVKTVNIKRFHHFLSPHMDIDEFNECLEKVLAMGFGYASDIELR